MSKEIIIDELEKSHWKDFPGAPGVYYMDIEGTIFSHGKFLARVKMIAGTNVPAHAHSSPFFDKTTVISGVLNIGIGAKLDKSTGTALRAGGVAIIPPGVSHYTWNDVETIVHVHGDGPWIHPRED